MGLARRAAAKERKDAQCRSAHPGAARQEHAPVLAAGEPRCHGSPLAPNLPPPGICPCHLPQHPPTGGWVPGDPAPAAAASLLAPRGAAWPAATFLHPDSAGRPDKEAIRGFGLPGAQGPSPAAPAGGEPGDETQSTAGPAPARGWVGLGLGKQSGEPQLESKVAGSRLQAAACGGSSDAGGPQPCSQGQPARPSPSPLLWPFRIKRQRVPTPPHAWKKHKGSRRCLPGPDPPAVGTAGPKRCSRGRDGNWGILVQLPMRSN